MKGIGKQKHGERERSAGGKEETRYLGRGNVWSAKEEKEASSDNQLFQTKIAVY